MFVAECRVPRVRTLREFVEQDIVLPNGPRKGLRFRCYDQPAAGLWFDLVDSRRWRRMFAIGPTQTGKTLIAWVAVLLYFLFELGEDVIAGVPDIAMRKDKWRLDILPVIRASKHRVHLPAGGAGSRGGCPELIEFANGTALRFMTSGGDDKARAAFTARVVCITETDGFDKSSDVSREADKFEQLCARTNAFGNDALIFAECTVSTEAGRSWSEYSNGTRTRLLRRCPHCAEPVEIGRDDFVGWKDAETVEDAFEQTEIRCPECAALWSDAERRAANASTIALHGDQDVDADGSPCGAEPRTDTLGFRWSAVDNHLRPIGMVGRDEWRAERASDKELAERKLRQFVHALPVVPAEEDLTELDPHGICHRSIGRPGRGVVPAGTLQLAAALDIGIRAGHWAVIGFGSGAAPHVVDYGVIRILSREMGVESALTLALDEFLDRLQEGWVDGAGEPVKPGLALADAGWQTEVVYTFCDRSGPLLRPAMGFGVSQDFARAYAAPKSTGARVVSVGDGYHVAKLQRPVGKAPVRLFELSADHWKLWWHSRLATPQGEPGAATVYAPARPFDHLTFARHQTSEKQVQEYVKGKGVVKKFVRASGANHWLDACYMACVAGHALGARLATDRPAPKNQPAPEPTTADDGERRPSRIRQLDRRKGGIRS